MEKAGPGELLCAEAPALFGALLKDRHVPAASRQVSTQRHPVVPGTDNHSVKRRVSHRRSPYMLNLVIAKLRLKGPFGP